MREYLKSLWTLRFEKMKSLESNSAWTYQEMLDECLSDSETDTKVVGILQMLIKEEKQHTRIAEELLHICRENYPQVGSLS